MEKPARTSLAQKGSRPAPATAAARSRRRRPRGRRPLDGTHLIDAGALGGAGRQEALRVSDHNLPSAAVQQAEGRKWVAFQQSSPWTRGR
jgi:hypothetical protein